ncbi:hypothetical protein Ddye_031267 [Dipteronia dyeriana]|uniref:RNase H type-1 domain-containing protein n=1 Tax=Dipteronia dyeriana TaxID=168575 RepID=A0AAD9TJ59_9ROSI|nr:hypothetical protein Ddye_031267 [Dipteronia dyeriana]
MLAKQCWRLIKRPDFLAAKVIKVSIYKERWISRPLSFVIQSSLVLGEHSTVRSLFTPFGCWNNQLIRAFISSEEVEAILSLPRGFSNVEDTILWHYDKNGCYSVRSGYKLGRMLLSRDVPSGSNNVEWWKSLWKLQLLHKKKELELGCVIFRRVWIWHNQCIHSSVSSSFKVEDGVEWATIFLKEFHKAHAVVKGSPSITGSVKAVKWCAPDRGFFKINTGMTIREVDKVVGVAVVLRNDAGRVMAFLARKISASYFPSMAEVVAILQGFRLAIEYG